MTSHRDVGEMGENLVKEWCAQNGIIANRVQRDKTGWDFLLEFPSDANISFFGREPLDLLPGSLRCMVQVKSTDQQPNRWPIKLSNWERFVKNPLPCFFLFLEYDHTNTCQRAYLVHVWAEEIGMILKKLRELPASKLAQLHKIMLPVKYRSYLQLPSLDGAGLAQAIQVSVAMSADMYAQQKNDIVKHVGYEQGNASVELTVLPSQIEYLDLAEYLVDFVLGLVPYLHIQSGIVTDVRFGIQAPEPLQILSEGKLEVSKKSIGAALIIIRSETGEELQIPAEVYAPQGIDLGQDNRLLKYRLAASNMDFIITTHPNPGLTITYRIPDADAMVMLSELEIVSEFLRLAATTPRQEFLQIEMFFQHQRLSSGILRVDNPMNEELVEDAMAVVYACRLLRFFGKETNIEVRFAELINQYSRLMILGRIISLDGIALAMEFTTSVTDPDDTRRIALYDKTYCCPIAFAVYIGDYRIICSLAVIGTLKPAHISEGESFRVLLESKDIRIVEKYIHQKQEPPRFTWEETIERAAQKFKGEMDVIIVRD